MKQRTAEKPEGVRIEPSAQAGFVEVVVVTNIFPQPVIHEDGQEATEYESDIYRLTYPATENLQKYAEKHKSVFVELAKAEEAAGQPTQSADKLAALMVENGDLRATQDDILVLITDLIGGVE